MITKTVGSGGDYAGLQAFADAIYGDGAGVNLMTDNITATIISDLAYSIGEGFTLRSKTSATPPPNTPPYNFPFTVTIRGNLGSSGVIGSYRKITMTSGATTSFYWSGRHTYPTDFGSWIFENIEFVGGSFAFGGGNSSDLLNLTIRNCVFNNSAIISSSSTGGTSSGSWLFYDLKMTNSTATCIDLSSGDPNGGTVKIENISATSTPGSTLHIHQSASTKSVKNVVAISPSGTAIDSTGTIAYSYCAANDTSLPAGTGNVASITPANEFVSTDPTNADFLKLKRTGTIYALGTTPTLTTTDIAGKAIPDAFGCYPIGCHVGERTGLPIDIECGFLNIGEGRQ